LNYSYIMGGTCSECTCTEEQNTSEIISGYSSYPRRDNYRITYEREAYFKRNQHKIALIQGWVRGN